MVGANSPAVANDDIDNALRYAGVPAELAKNERGERRQLVRLDDDGVARHSAGPTLRANSAAGKFQAVMPATTP
jgi:hypothetical protein